MVRESLPEEVHLSQHLNEVRVQPSNIKEEHSRYRQRLKDRQMGRKVDTRWES